jgi:hypothetical protein
MNDQKENSRMNEDNISDKNIDVTRSENRQAVQNANKGDNADNEVTPGKGHHHGGDETGSHIEGQGPHNSMKPFVDKEGAGEAGAGGDDESNQ